MGTPRPPMGVQPHSPRARSCLCKGQSCGRVRWILWSPNLCQRLRVMLVLGLGVGCPVLGARGGTSMR